MSAALTVAFVAPGIALAQGAKPVPKQIGTYGDWSAWELADGRNRICYAAARPKASDDKGTKRNVVQIQISNRTADKVKNEVGVYLGYVAKPQTKITATVDSDAFDLVGATQEGYRETAWIHDAKREAQLVDAMMKGSSLKVSATPNNRRDAIIDTYSLNGVTAALKAIADRCK